MLRPQTRSNRTETLCPYKTRFRSDAGLLALLPAAEAVAKHAGAVGLAVLRAAEHRAEHAADVAAGMVLLQRAEQRLRAFGLAGVAAQRAHQQRQRGADGGRGLGGIDAQLLRDLLDRCALELRGEVVGVGGHRACPWEVRDGHPTTTMLRGRQSRAGPSMRRPQSPTSPC